MGHHATQKTIDNKGIMRANNLQIRVQQLVIQYQMVCRENTPTINITDTEQVIFRSITKCSDISFVI